MVIKIQIDPIKDPLSVELHDKVLKSDQLFGHYHPSFFFLIAGIPKFFFCLQRPFHPSRCVYALEIHKVCHRSQTHRLCRNFRLNSKRSLFSCPQRLSIRWALRGNSLLYLRFIFPYIAVCRFGRSTPFHHFLRFGQCFLYGQNGCISTLYLYPKTPGKSM